MNWHCRKTVAVIAVIALMSAAATAICSADDQREDAHGMNYVRNPVTGESYLFWSDEYDTGSTDDGNWTHDVFYQKIDTAAPKLAKKKLLIHAKEAQEPASVSCTANGNFFITFEDGNTEGHGGLSQRYAVYDRHLNVIKAYPQTIRLGGHSGHCACAGNTPVVFWNDDWVDGGGVDNLGTGKDLYVTSLDADGNKTKTVAVAKGKTRDWWPMLAASDRKVLLLWQRYVKGETYSHICYAMYDPASGKLCSVPGKSGKTHVLKKIRARYYTYNVVYLSKIRRYVINISTRDGKGIILLLDGSGKIIYEKKGLPGFVRESSPAVRNSGKAVELCYPKAKSGAMFFRVTRSRVHFSGKVSGKYKWGYRGTSGFYDDGGNSAYFATLTSKKVRLVRFERV